MRRKLLLLDIALLIALSAGGFQFRRQWQAQKAREAKVPVPVKPVAVPPLAPIPKQPDVVPASYIKIADQMLFDRSRNSVVAPPPPPPPPPPKPMPPFPVFHGMMNIGKSGPIAILSVNKGAPHQAIHPGEGIGQFKLVDVNSNGITLEWDGKTIYKDAEELSDRAAGPSQDQGATDSRPAAPVANLAPPPEPLKGPGETTNFGFKICNINDGHNEGEVIDGYRKVVHISPFGKSCTYDRAQ